MAFEWDVGKAESNFSKHDVSFNAAQDVFEDPYPFAMADNESSDEERFVTMRPGNCC